MAGATTQKTVIFKLTTVSISNHMKLVMLHESKLVQTKKAAY
jgi:hypothetical protein